MDGKRLRLAASVMSIMVAACASAPGGGDPASSSVSGDADVITRAEIDRGQWRDAWDLVQSLRPRWIQARGVDSLIEPGQVQVYIDGTRLGDVTLLRGIPTMSIIRLEWIDPVAAAGRWGMGHAHGVIAITHSPAQDPPRL
jgi:hypothetical protein